GAFWVLARYAAGTRRVAGILARATPIEDAGTLALVREVAARHGLRRAPRLLMTPETSVALTAGVRNPVVLLPEEPWKWTPERKKLVLLHEMAHVERRDCLSLVLVAAATAAYWFHPLVWALAARLRRDGELACDDAVLASGARASDYAGELLAIFRS